MEKIIFRPENDEEVAFYVLEQTTIGGNNYILVTDSEEEEDGEALILKEIKSEDDTESVYEAVEEDELDAVAAVFGNLLEDITLSGESQNY